MTEPPGGWTSPNERPPAPSGWGPPPQGRPGGWGSPAEWAGPPPRPGIIPLRPLSVGEILDGAISAIRAQPRAMVGLSALFAALIQLLQLPVTWLLLQRSLADVQAGAGGSGALGFGDAGTTLGTLLGAVVGGLVTLVLTGVLTVIVSRAVLGDRRTAREAWQQARPRLPTLLALAGLLALVSVLVLVGCLGPGLLVLATGAGAAAAALLVVGAVLALALLVYVFVLFSLAPPAAVLERQPARRALSRSRALLRGSWWRCLGVILLINVVAQILSAVLGLPFAAGFAATVFASGGDGAGPIVLLGLLVLTLGSILGTAVTLPFTAAGTALLYIDLRMRREGLDIALARAAGEPGRPGTDPLAPSAAEPSPPAYGSPPGS